MDFDSGTVLGYCGHACVVLFFSSVFFFKILRGVFVGPLITLFLTSGDVSSWFQSQSGQPYLQLAERCTCYIFP